MKSFAGFVGLASAFVAFSSAVARAAEVLPEDLVVVQQSMKNVVQRYQGERTAHAHIQFNDLSCFESPGSQITCRFQDAWTNQAIELTEAETDDRVFDLQSAIFRITGSADTQLLGLSCRWNDSRLGPKNIACTYSR